MEDTLKCLMQMTDINSQETIFVDTLKGVNSMMRLGGFVSRKLRIVSIGRPLVLKGTKKAYQDFVGIAEDVRSQISQLH